MQHFHILVYFKSVLIFGFTYGSVHQREIQTDSNNLSRGMDGRIIGGKSRNMDGRIIGGKSRSMDGRIIGGKGAMLGQVPYQVSLQFKNLNNKHFCGGSIYSDRYVISAAHCFFEDPSTQFDITNIEVVAGAFNLASPGQSEQRRGIASRTLYPGYKLYPGYNDVAVITLASPLVLSKTIKPIRIAAASEEPAGSAQLSGWGYSKMLGKHQQTRDDGYPKILQVVEVDIINKRTCEALNIHGALAQAKHERILCAGALKGGRDSCEGDSGGPLVCRDRNHNLYLCGVVQGGISCGQANSTGFYTQVSKVRDFIISVAGQQKL